MPVPGTRLGSYEILSPLGAGGMGEVYRARDHKLGREVALKILPEHLASDPDRLARFQREAQVLASLNHPHIAGIYGIEDSDDVRALVLELVEGETLAERISRGPIPVDEALTIAKQIAQALEAAHEQGVIHRDLKPANIKITPDGVTKVLDFGLAKLTETAVVPANSSAVSMSPTITSPAMTHVGMILGTVAYMSPEQAKGRPADRRSDVWAFGCVLFEMLTAKRAFEGEDVAETLASVLKGNLDWQALPPIPPLLRHLLREMLQRDRSRRLSSVAPALFDIVDDARDPPPRSRWLLPAIAALLLSVLLAAAWLLTRDDRSPQVVRRTLLSPGFGQSLGRPTGTDPDVAFSPDGTRIAYTAAPTAGTVSFPQLWIRAIDQLQPILIKTNGAAHMPCFSPDGRWIAFLDGVILKKVDASGGTPTEIVSLDNNPSGATWSDDDRIIFATGDTGKGLREVSAGGGEIRPLTTVDSDAPDVVNHRWPEGIAGRKAVLFTIWKGSIEKSDIALLDLESKRHRVLVTGGSHAKYLPSGHLMYAGAGGMRVATFDIDTLTVGDSVVVSENVLTKGTGAASFAVSHEGSLVYFTGGTAVTRSFAWIGFKGTAMPPNLIKGPYLHPRISPDGTRFVYTRQDPDSELWIYDFKRRIPERLTFSPGADRDAAWSRDGKRLAYFSSGVEGGSGIFVIAADGTAKPERLTTGDHRPISWSGDDQQVVFVSVSGETGTNDIGAVSVTGTHQISMLLATENIETHPEVSPGGRWLAYRSNEAGPNAIYVRPYSGGRRTRISEDGGDQPFWARDGGTLFFRQQNRLMAVRNTNGAVESWSSPQVVLELPPNFAQTDVPRNIDVAPDGRFLILTQDDEPDSEREIVLVEQWFSELQRLVPAH